MPPGARRPRPLVIGALACVALAVAAGLGWWGHRAPASSQPTYHRLTFRRGTIATARFAPDRKTVVYGAAWEGAPVETFLVTADSPESRTLGVPGSDVYAVSPSSELALSLRPDGSLPPLAGTLARAPLLAGAAPREVMDKVEYADWGPSDTMAVTLDTGVGDRLEYPVGTMLYRSAGAHPPDSRRAGRRERRVLGTRPRHELGGRHRSKPPEALALRGLVGS